MNDRKSFLAAIFDAPNDDMPRLAFADWLDENAESDRDRATAEFIRVSCLGRKHASALMPKVAYEWIAEHWQRLVPTVLTRHVKAVVRPGPHGERADDPVPFKRDGRTVRASVRLPIESPLGAPAGELHWYTVLFDFSRGFLRVAALFSPNSFRHLAVAVHVDQPFARLDCVGADDSVLRMLRGLVAEEAVLK